MVAETFRLRVCFKKTGRLRHLSHLETIRACERAARRAGMPYAVTQGFTPRMRIAFGPALPVGTAGEREYYDLLLTRYVPAEEVLSVLRQITVDDLAPVACRYVDAREPSLAAALTIAEYVVVVEGGIPPQDVGHSLAELADRGTLTVEHKGKTKVFDLAEALPKKPEVQVDKDCAIVRMFVRMGERGSLRPEVLIGAALPGASRTIVTRCELLIDDEGVWRRPL